MRFEKTELVNLQFIRTRFENSVGGTGDLQSGPAELGEVSEIRIFWPLRYDAWLDNGLEVWGCILEEVSRQFPNLLTVHWQNDGLLIEAEDSFRLVPLLDETIGRRAERSLFYTTERDGQRRSIILPFIGFNQQPPGQRPIPYLDDQVKRRALLEAVLQDSDGGEKPCPLCGAAMGASPQTLTLSVYPLVTKNKAFSGARTRWTGEGYKGRPTNVDACPRCYLLGALGWADDALLYLCDLGRNRDTSVVVAPVPVSPDLAALHEQKNGYRHSLRQERRRRTNVYFRLSSDKTPGEGEDEDAVPEEEAASEERPVAEGRFCLLTAFLERSLWEVAQRRLDFWALFEAARRMVPQGWLFVTMPQGRMKNVTAHDLVLDERTIALLVQLVEEGVQPYAHIFTQVGLVDEKGRPLYEEQAEMREAMSRGLLTDSFSAFARGFLPRTRRQLRLYGLVAERIETLVREWRWKEMQEHLDTVRKAGSALAEIAASRRQPVVLYGLERVRSRSDLLVVLKEAVHRLIGLSADDMRYISVAALEELVQLLNREEVPFEDLKNTLFVFAGVAYARKTMAQSRGQQGGEANA